MKFYGYNTTCALRGDLEAVTYQTPGRDADLGQRYVLSVCEWDKVFTRFDSAKKALIADMEAEGVDPELTALVRTLKAGHLQARFIT